MTRSAQKFSVFEFDEEEERVEKESARFVGKFRIQKRKRNDKSKDDDVSPLTKYKFLQCFSGCTGDVKVGTSNEPIDIDDEQIDIDTGVAGETNTLCKEISSEVVVIDATVIDDQCQYSVSAPVSLPQEDSVVNGGETNTLCKGNCNEVLDIDATVIDDQCQYYVSAPAPMPQEDCPVKEEISRLDTLRLSSFSDYENEPVGMISDSDVSIEMSSSTSGSTVAENEVALGNQVLECVSFGHKIDYTNNTVAVFPDYVLCGDIYGTESCLTFSGRSIRMEGSTATGVKGIFNAEWALGDIISIESEWLGMVKNAVVYLCFKSKVSEGAEITNDTSGVDKLKFSVYDPLWHEGEEAIKSLHVSYSDNWNATSDSDRIKDGNAFFGHNGMVISKPYFPVRLHETFEEVIYPEGDPDAVSISKRDVEVLHRESFINDTVIDFYIQYLKNKLQPEDSHRFHFFNSFFFRKLADLDKGPTNTCEGRQAFQRVHKWTRKMNLFEKDYIFIPINYSLHWSLIVICHPGEVAHSREDEGRNSVKVPCILHMDSIRGSHRGLKNLIQRYLYEEWKERHNETLDDTLSKFLHLRFVPLELPQQENSYDCGLFLLHYVECFLEEAPINFNPFKITEFSNFLNRNWFLPMEASLKRARIQQLICKILEDQSSTQPNEEETRVEFPAEICSAVSGPDTNMGFQISLTAKSPTRVAQQQKRLGELGLNSWGFFEQGTSSRSFSNEDCCRTSKLYWRSCMSPIEEAEETGEQISDFRSLSLSKNQKHTQLEETSDDSTSDSPFSGSLKSSEIGVGVDVDYLVSQYEGLDYQKQTYCYELSSNSTDSEEFADCVVEDSQEGNSMHDDCVANDSSSSSHCNNLAASVDAKNTTENILRKVRKPVSIVDVASDEETAERTKLTSSDGT